MIITQMPLGLGLQFGNSLCLLVERLMKIQENKLK